MKKEMKVVIELPPSGAVKSHGPNGPFSGGISPPNLSGELTFTVHREEIDENGIWNPLDGQGPFDGAFQINLSGTSAGYRRLAEYFLALSEIDTSADPGFHEHIDGLVSADGATRFDLILRKEWANLET